MPLVARALFGIRFAPALSETDYYFDVTTFALFQFLAKRLDRRSQLLDMGTGSAAVLGLSLWRRVGCQVISSDIDPALVTSARRNVAHNGAPIEVVQSTYFDAVPDRFHVVSFNPPYVPTSAGEERGLRERRTQWDGGTDGTHVIAGYLDAVAALGRPITSHLGMNRQHVDGPKMSRVLAGRKLRTSVFSHPLLPVDVYTIVCE